MKHTIVIIFILLPGILFGQSFDSFMQSVAQNNPRLIALDKWLDAEETKAKTGIYPNNPEVSYNYLFGNTDAIGDQQELEITQAFKLPGYYTSKSTVQQLDFQQKQALAENEKRDLLHSARSAWFKLVWFSKKESLLQKRNEDAKNLVSLIKEGFEGGEFSKPAYDKARIYAIGIQNEWNKTKSKIVVQEQYLMQLNGSSLPENLVYEYPVNWQIPVLDSVLSKLSEKNPDLIVAQLNIQQSESEVKHQKMTSLPSFEAGYKSETILNQKLQGFHAGMSIPLWQNKNSVKHAKLQTEWSKANLLQQESEIKTQVSSLYYEVLALKENYEQMNSILMDGQVSESSFELLQSGQNSFTEYLVDVDLIWEVQCEFMKNENAYFVLLSHLKNFE